MVQWGNIADWFAAVGTVSAVGVSLYLIWNERKLRLSQQAHRVAVWAEWRREDHSDVTPRQYFAYINNASDSPIYGERLTASTAKGSDPLMRDSIGIVSPHGFADYGLYENDFPPEGDVPYVELQFFDVDRVRWSCDSEGSLRRVGSAT
jgi:hypothetical protein